mmetsp:Transcript_39992/g.104220  ORF Transcript_39992/g.104220 Transcript_39992/m.104220 type:complete len:313 (-) Transcript_39992:281-1219(-)
MEASSQSSRYGALCSSDCSAAACWCGRSKTSSRALVGMWDMSSTICSHDWASDTMSEADAIGGPMPSPWAAGSCEAADRPDQRRRSVSSSKFLAPHVCARPGAACGSGAAPASGSRVPARPSGGEAPPSGPTAGAEAERSSASGAARGRCRSARKKRPSSSRATELLGAPAWGGGRGMPGRRPSGRRRRSCSVLRCRAKSCASAARLKVDLVRRMRRTRPRFSWSMALCVCHRCVSFSERGGGGGSLSQLPAGSASAEAGRTSARGPPPRGWSRGPLPAARTSSVSPRPMEILCRRSTSFRFSRPISALLWS